MRARIRVGLVLQPQCPAEYSRPSANRTLICQCPPSASTNAMRLVRWVPAWTHVRAPHTG